MSDNQHPDTAKLAALLALVRPAPECDSCNIREWSESRQRFECVFATQGDVGCADEGATRPDCRLTCGTERHAAALSQSPHGLPPVGIATAPVDGPVAVIRIGQPSTLVLASPPSPPPPRA